MVKFSQGAVDHDSISGVSASDHHTQTVAGDLNLADLAARAHGDLSDSPADAHHAATHTVLSHSDGADACKIAHGSYTGDGAASQAITGVGFTVLALFITVRKTGETTPSDRGLIVTWESMVDNSANGMVATIDDTAGIQSYDENAVLSLDADGFTVDDNGANNHPNTNSTVYDFVAWGIEV